MEFIGLEPFEAPMDAEVRHAGRVYDLHNTGWLRDLTYRPLERVLLLRWNIESPPDMKDRELVAKVALRFEEVTDLEAEVLTTGHEESASFFLLDAFFRMPEQNGPDWIEIQFLREARLAFKAKTCIATIEHVK
jgi:hypothetical protein